MGVFALCWWRKYNEPQVLELWGLFKQKIYDVLGQSCTLQAFERELYLGSHSELKELWSSIVDGRGAWISLELALICSSSRGRLVSFLFHFYHKIRIKKTSKAESHL